MEGRIKVWQCGKHYAKKGEHLCDGRMIRETELYKAFQLAWDHLVEERDNKAKDWEKKMAEGNALEAYRAEQFLRLTANGGRIKEGKPLVSAVLDHIVFEKNGDLSICFLDGSHVCVEP